MPAGPPHPGPFALRRSVMSTLAVGLLAVTACTSGSGFGPDDQPGRGSPTSTSGLSRSRPFADPNSPATSASSTTEETTTVTTIRLTIADQAIIGELNDTTTAQDLARQLPLTLTGRDFNQVEKVVELPAL